jgi:Kdo2-lipid IVA lauroyltransferase/acyltransferase
MNRFFNSVVEIVPRLPGWFRRAMPGIIAPFAYIVAAKNRRQATVNASHVLGPDSLRSFSGRLRLRGVVVEMFRNSIANYIDLLAMPGTPAQEILDRIDGADQHVIDEALALGKGAIVFGAHFGPIEKVGLWFAAHGYRVVIPVENVKDEKTLRLTTRLRNMTGTEFVPLGGVAGVRALLTALHRKQIVLLTADRALGASRSVVHPFFGAPARLPVGLVDLAIRTGAPLLGGFCWRTPSDRTGMKISHLTMRLPPEERSDPSRLHAELALEMERTIATHPGQWVVFQPVWIDEGEDQP